MQLEMQRTEHFLCLSHKPDGPTSGTGTGSRADIPQNTPDLGQLEKKTVTSCWCGVTRTVGQEGKNK